VSANTILLYIDLILAEGQNLGELLCAEGYAKLDPLPAPQPPQSTAPLSTDHHDADDATTTTTTGNTSVIVVVVIVVVVSVVVVAKPTAGTTTTTSHCTTVH